MPLMVTPQTADAPRAHGGTITVPGDTRSYSTTAPRLTIGGLCASRGRGTLAESACHADCREERPRCDPMERPSLAQAQRHHTEPSDDRPGGFVLHVPSRPVPGGLSRRAAWEGTNRTSSPANCRGPLRLAGLCLSSVVPWRQGPSVTRVGDGRGETVEVRHKRLPA